MSQDEPPPSQDISESSSSPALPAAPEDPPPSSPRSSAGEQEKTTQNEINDNANVSSPDDNYIPVYSTQGGGEREEEGDDVIQSPSMDTLTDDDELIQKPATRPLISSSSSDGDEEEAGSMPRSDRVTVGRHLRRPLHVRGRQRKGMRQALQRLRKSRAGSSRLRMMAVPPVPARTPMLRRTTTGGSTKNDSTTTSNNQDGMTTPPPPPSHRSTKSAGTISSITKDAVVSRVDHLRRLAYRRLIQSGLVWERLGDRATGSLEVRTSRERPVLSDDDEIPFDEETTSVRGMDIVIRPEVVPASTPTPPVPSSSSSSLRPPQSKFEEAKEPESDSLDIVGLATASATTTPLRAVPEAHSDRTVTAAIMSTETIEEATTIVAGTATPPRTAVTTPVASNTSTNKPVSKPSLLKRVSSLSSIASGKFGSGHSSISGDDFDDDMAYLLGGPPSSCDYVKDFLNQIDEDEDQKLLEEIRREILAAEHTSKLSDNLQMIQNMLKGYAVLYPTSSTRGASLRINKSQLCTGEDDAEDMFDGMLEEYPVQVRLHNVTYQVQQPVTRNKIPTVYNTSFAYPITKAWKRWRKDGFNAAWHQFFDKPEYETVDILKDIDLVLQPGRSYLVLGPPASGKTSLLKAVAGRLRPDVRQHWSAGDDSSFAQDRTNESCHGSVATGIAEPCEVPEKPCTILQGRIQYNGRSIPEGGKEFHIENAMVYIDQLDQHAARLTVDEVFEFAFQCKTGGNPFRDVIATDDKVKQAMEQAKENRLRVTITLQALGLTHVKDTFVGDHSVRGISGGQRRRVTVGEMIMDRAPVLCGDEISTGLDAASTYDMIETLLYFGRLANMTRLIALLQPSPETVSLFDEVVLLGEGRILYAGPMEDVEGYFADLGYRSPEFMDVADFLQQVSTEDGAQLYHPTDEIKAFRPNAPTVQELADIFRDSFYGQRIREELYEPHQFVWRSTDEGSNHGSRISGITKSHTVTNKYANNFTRSSWLITQRFLKLWTRDVRVIIAAAVKNVLMGVSVGGVFNSIQDEISITGALFQAGLFIMLGAIQTASSMVADRVIFYKHADANFYSAWPFVFGRTLSNLPQTVADVLLFGTILYYMVGLAGREDLGNFLRYLCILIMFSLVMQQQLAVFAAVTSPSGLQIFSSILLLFLILFGGFIVSPEAIPWYWSWVYWWNPFAWAYRALVINEFRSERWPDPEATLERVGYANESESKWIGLAFIYLGAYFVVCCFLTAVGLTFVRQDKQAGSGADSSHKHMHVVNQSRITIEFKPVDLTFKDICYDVTASKGKGTLRLLNNVNGVFKAGRMCALMGSSGAGKSTLMDVIAGRKNSGTISGEVRLNGFIKDPASFRRASGYVEQFDVQSPELTVRETVLFSARLRIDRTIIEDEDDIQAYVDVVLADVELDELADAIVGDDEGPGLSFEQKKRLSIAVELAASPSIIFLDEPTSGLDARSALLVVRTLRTIANAGRTICATIHQPSSTVFDMFDDLLLLKKGGEVVYHGPTGTQSAYIVKYFESMGAPRIEIGENPANWMLRVMSNEKLGDLAKKFRLSNLYRETKEKLESIAQSEPDPSKKIEYQEKFATTKRYRQSLVTTRVRLIYWRSPAYNLARMMVSGIVGLILGSLFVPARFDEDYSESDIRARLSVTFLSFIITGMLAIFGSIPVMTKLRDMFYRHRTSGMYGSSSIGVALGSAEKPFIILSCSIFTLVFLSAGAMMSDGVRFIRGILGFWGFFTFNFAIYSYFGQAFVCLVKPTATALILSSVFIGLNNFFSGLIVRPQFMVGTFFALPYYISPGHFVYEGMVTSLYSDDTRAVFADVGSEFWQHLVEVGECTVDEVCIGTVETYVKVFFGGEFSIDNTRRNALILGFVLILTRFLTWLSLKYIRFSD